MASSAGTRFLVPIYPLAPIGTAAAVIPEISELTMKVCADVGSESTFIIGDSAGGTISLAVAMQLRNRGVPVLRNTMLISPALDLTFTDPLIDQIEPHDPMLARRGARAAANLWRGELPIKDPMVSPLFGELAGLGPITMFSGTYDSTNTDAKRFAVLAKEAGTQLHYQELEKMLHVYCDAVAVDFSSKCIFLCEITFSDPPTGLLKRLSGWESDWAGLSKALIRDSDLPSDWPIWPWPFVPEKLVPKVLTGLMKIAPISMPTPRITPLEMVFPWQYRSWNREREKQKTPAIPENMC